MSRNQLSQSVMGETVTEKARFKKKKSKKALADDSSDHAAIVEVDDSFMTEPNINRQWIKIGAIKEKALAPP